MAQQLTKDDLHALSGYSRPSEQCGWLRRNGIGHTTDRFGHPVTTWHLVELALTGVKANDDGYHAPKIRTA